MKYTKYNKTYNLTIQKTSRGKIAARGRGLCPLSCGLGLFIQHRKCRTQ